MVVYQELGQKGAGPWVCRGCRCGSGPRGLDLEHQLADSKIRHRPVIVHRCAFIEKSLLGCVWLVSSWDPGWRHREPGVKDTLWVTSGGIGGS